MARARLDHENQSRAVPLEALQGRPGGLYGPLNEGLGVGCRARVEPLGIAQPGRVGGFQTRGAGERLGRRSAVDERRREHAADGPHLGAHQDSPGLQEGLSGRAESRLHEREAETAGIPHPEGPTGEDEPSGSLARFGQVAAPGSGDSAHGALTVGKADDQGPRCHGPVMSQDRGGRPSSHPNRP